MPPSETAWRKIVRSGFEAARLVFGKSVRSHRPNRRLVKSGAEIGVAASP